MLGTMLATGISERGIRPKAVWITKAASQSITASRISEPTNAATTSVHRLVRLSPNIFHHRSNKAQNVRTWKVYQVS
jgi:hypothetical protein